MDDVDVICTRFPAEAKAIRRLYGERPEFRALCGDFIEASRALVHWHSVESPPRARIEEYTQLVHELEAEIHEALRQAD